MGSEEEAKTCIENLNNSEFMGSTITVEVKIERLIFLFAFSEHEVKQWNNFLIL